MKRFASYPSAAPCRSQTCIASSLLGQSNVDKAPLMLPAPSLVDTYWFAVRTLRSNCQNPVRFSYCFYLMQSIVPGRSLRCPTHLFDARLGPSDRNRFPPSFSVA